MSAEVSSKLRTVIGTDEAGYGPNLGPLLIAATVWTNESERRESVEELPKWVLRERSRWLSMDKGERANCLLVTDSKQVYQSGKIELLERGVLALLCSQTGKVPRSLGELAECVGIEESAFSQPGFGDSKRLRSLKIPIASNVELIERLGSKLCQEAESRLQEVRCRAVFAGEFNSLCEELGNKATLLSTCTMRIVDELSRDATGKLEVICDKHGGRNRYAGLLQQELSLCDNLIRVVEEGRRLSRYSVGSRGVKVSFCASGEIYLPIAAASMMAKYLRELFMMGWNQYWAGRVPDIRPTRGYPVDAKRFLSEIDGAICDDRMDRGSIWRFK